MIEFWTNGAGMPSAFVRRAQRAEAAGFDGITIVDSQNLSGDCYIALAMAASATTRIKLGTGVTNPFTRHPVVTAGAIATVQAVSEGRAHLGIGRGDSALAHLGYAPASPRTLAGYLRSLQGYLAGDEVPFDEAGDLARLHLANQPTSSRIGWIRPGRYPKVTVDVTATGPKVIAIGATLGDMVSFAVGADPARVRWGIDTARSARCTAGLDPDALRLSAYVNVVVHDDPETARRLGEGGLAEKRAKRCTAAVTRRRPPSSPGRSPASSGSSAARRTASSGCASSSSSASSASSWWGLPATPTAPRSSAPSSASRRRSCPPCGSTLHRVDPTHGGETHAR